MTLGQPESLTGLPFFCSWSGGKDSCLALYHAIKSGGRPHSLLTILAEDGLISRSHGLPKRLLEAQAKSLGLRPVFRAASWEHYDEEFVSALHEFKASGIEAGVFGDIDLDAHREWARRVCGRAGIAAFHPLWKRDRRELLEEFIGLGFKARIIAVNEEKLDKSFLGRTIQTRTIEEMEEAGIDPAGECGEYHTVVTGGPLFSAPVELKIVGEECHGGYRFLRVDS
ncbi:MAG: diphthine--ammonia ligase [Firmicutes bacterium]|nr:diphthine--ammonia ligase [Bacillota bacterium]